MISAIKRAVETVMEWEDFKNKLVALGSDGASVMLGKNNGVIALLWHILSRDKNEHGVGFTRGCLF